MAAAFGVPCSWPMMETPLLLHGENCWHQSSIASASSSAVESAAAAAAAAGGATRTAESRRGRDGDELGRRRK